MKVAELATDWLGEEYTKELADTYPTVQSFLLNPLAKPFQTNKAGPSQQAVDSLSACIAMHIAPRVCNGQELLERVSNRTRLLPTGCDSVDQLLRGGLREGQMTEVAGESASGKTQLCLSAALRTAMRGERVVFVDTSMSFSARRLAEMHSKALPPIQQAGRLTLEEALACITVYRVHDVWEALNVVSDVHETATQAKDSASGPRVLILDSLSAILSPIVGGKQQQGHALMVCLARGLHRLACEFCMAVVVTNHLVRSGKGDGDSMKPALGEHWRCQPHARMVLEQGPEGQRRVVLAKSTIGGTGCVAAFELWEGGLQACELPRPLDGSP
mmetsp:Transcript_571/g.1723  ORF Transcript_571/g.1723 Transcript_571/m.1723 type:complete len:330 (-) Transcript_571:687-1676(-)